MIVTYNWLKEYIDFPWSCEELVNKLAEVGLETKNIIQHPILPDDKIIEFEVTSNRPDWLSVLGIAKEISAILGSPIHFPEIKIQETEGNISTFCKVDVINSAACPRYSARVVTNIKVAPSPAFIANRLEAVGIRPINNIVDITNYVMVEYGQPLHAFDLDLLEGKKIIVRNAAPNERIVTLDNQEHTLDSSMLVIADARKPVALAGIMGGSNSMISFATKNVLLESAYFNPSTVRRTAKRLSIKTESSYRFERGTNPAGTVEALNRASQLIKELCPSAEIVKGVIDIYPSPFISPSIKLRFFRVNQILGKNLPKEVIEDILKRLGCEIILREENVIEVKPPIWRRDLKEEIDLIEEVARLYNYNNIPTVIPQVRLRPYKERKIVQIEKTVRSVLSALGFQEAINYNLSNSDNGVISVQNPLSKELSVLRSHLIPSLCENLSTNLKYGITSVNLFEIGKAMQISKSDKDKEEFVEELHAAVISFCKEKSKEWSAQLVQKDFYFLKGVLESLLERLHLPERVYASTTALSHFEEKFFSQQECASVFCADQKVGVIGKLAAEFLKKYDIAAEEVYAFELNLSLIEQMPFKRVEYHTLPKYPAIYRDISLLVPPNVTSSQIVATIFNNSDGKIESVELFDLYQGERIPAEYRSLAYHIVYRDSTRTLSEEEVNIIENKIFSALEKELGLKVRKEK